MQKQKYTKLKRWPLAVGVAATLAVAALVPSSAFAWGPERTTFTMESPADYVTFNSITNNNKLGDERNFVRVGEADSSEPYRDEMKVVPGKTYEVYIFYHNNAKSSLNSSGKGIATGVVMSAQYPSVINSENKGKVSAIISSAVANPTQVWDEAYFVTDSKENVKMRYVSGSATIHNDWGVNGRVLPEGLFGNGTFLGLNELDGWLPGCSEYAGYVTYRLRAEQVGAKVKKTVSKDGVNFFDKVSDVQPGDILTYKVSFENIGTSMLADVTFRDRLPAGVTLVDDTTSFIDSDGNSLKLDNKIGENGYNMGNYNQGTTSTLTYQVRVNDDIVKDADCGTYQFTNKIIVDYTDGEINDGASFEIVKTGCEDVPPTPACEDGDPSCTPENDCKEGEPGCTTPEELPKTGPAQIALAVTAIIAVVVGASYLYSSQKALEETKAAVGVSHKKTTHKDKK